MNYDTLTTALKAGVLAAAGSKFTSARVLWAHEKYQGGARPVGDRFITLQIGSLMPIGVDGYTTTYDGTRAVGSEIELATISQREFTLMLQCYGGTPWGEGSALAALSKARERLSLPTVRAIFTAAGVTPFAPGPVRNVPAIEGTKFESRAVCDVRCYVDASESEYVGLIQHVEVGQTIGGVYIGTFQIHTGD